MNKSSSGAVSGQLAILAKPNVTRMREELIELVRRDLKGPGGGPEQQIDPAHFSVVHECYVVGTLALRGLDDLAATVTLAGDDSHETEDKQGAPAFLPSSFSLSCCIDGGQGDLVLQPSFMW